MAKSLDEILATLPTNGNGDINAAIIRQAVTDIYNKAVVGTATPTEDGNIVILSTDTAANPDTSGSMDDSGVALTDLLVKPIVAGSTSDILINNAGLVDWSTPNTAFNKNFGAATGDVCQGDDARLSDARAPLAHSNHVATDITDFDTEVSNNITVAANAAHVIDTNNPHGVAASDVAQGGAVRPVSPVDYEMFFDTNLATPRPIWYDGAQWVDATGTPA